MHEVAALDIQRTHELRNGIPIRQAGDPQRTDLPFDAINHTARAWIGKRANHRGHPERITDVCADIYATSFR